MNQNISDSSNNQIKTLIENKNRSNSVQTAHITLPLQLQISHPPPPPGPPPSKQQNEVTTHQPIQQQALQAEVLSDVFVIAPKPRREKRKFKSYPQDKMIEAVKYFKDHKDKESFRVVAKRYQVPYSTLRRWIKNNYSVDDPYSIPRSGPPTYLNGQEEEQLKDWILDMQRRALSVDFQFAGQKVRQLLMQKGVSINTNLPGKNFWKCFRRRHPCVSIGMARTSHMNNNKKSQAPLQATSVDLAVHVSPATVMAVSSNEMTPPHSLSASNNISSPFNRPTSVTSFFNSLREVYEKYRFPPQLVWNCDEIGIQGQDICKRPLCSRKTTRNLTRQPKISNTHCNNNLNEDIQTAIALVSPGISVDESQNEDASSQQMPLLSQAPLTPLHEQFAVMTAVSALGSTVPPIFLFRDEHLKDSFLSHAQRDSSGIVAPNGWLDADTFVEWLRHFARHAPSGRPLLMLTHYHESRFSLPVLEAADKEGIILFCLPPKTPNIASPTQLIRERERPRSLQPLDICISSFRQQYLPAFQQFVQTGQQLSPPALGALVSSIWDRAFSMSNVLSGFATPGIYPFNPGLCGVELNEAHVIQAIPPPISEKPTSIESLRSTGNILQDAIHSITHQKQPESLILQDVGQLPQDSQQYMPESRHHQI